jgi:short-subunit dehydrogenase
VAAVKIHGARVLVTGASRGIGRATALELARRGADLALAARDTDALKEVAAACRGEGVAAHAITTDVADEAQVRRMVRSAERILGGLDILVNNAGLGLTAPVAEIDPDDLRYVFQVNVMGAHVATVTALPGMRERGRGHIVNVGSVASHISVPNLGGYSATKFALKALTDALRMELRGAGIGVTLICPGPIRTDFVAATRGDARGRLPLKPVGAPAEDVGRAIADAIAKNHAEVFVPAYYQAVVGANSVAPQVMRVGGKRMMRLSNEMAKRFMR